MNLASEDASKKKAHGNTRSNGRRAKEKGKSFQKSFRSGGEENERRMANNVMKEMRVYDGYLACLDLA